MHRLLLNQISKAKAASGHLDLDALLALVDAVYQQFDAERTRSERATRLMIDEVEAHNRARAGALAQIAAQGMRMDAALNNMAQGLAMFDANVQLVIANKQFAKIYGLDDKLLVAGTSVHDIVAYRMRSGFCGDISLEEILKTTETSVSKRQPANYVTTLIDGRFIAVCAQPMADGGWVTTHQDITEQRRTEAKISHMALHDGLTDLPNRLLLNERLELALALTGRGESIAVHYLDLDQFKQVNDTHGHGVGDRLLNLVADRLRHVVGEGDTIARMGGDEFAIVQTSLSGPPDAQLLAELVITSISEPYVIDDLQIVIGTSVGIAVAPTDAQTAAELLRKADLALYRAKSSGRGTFCFFELPMDVEMQERHALEQELREALNRNQFEVKYQPIAEMNHQRITAFEALIRWNHPQMGQISPSVFIPLAEESGLIVPIGEWVIRTACAVATEWPEDIAVAINLSPEQLRHSGLVKVVADALEASGLPASRLELEITETALVHDGEATLKTLSALRELGTRIAMDDFGTGYSSLSHLQRFTFDKIKIDRSFVQSMEQDARARNIIRAVGVIAMGLGVEATAEGVETLAQLEAVRSEGCTEIQGFLLSEAIRPSAIPALLERNASNVQPRSVAA